jgi:hypothetical protein
MLAVGISVRVATNFWTDCTHGHAPQGGTEVHRVSLCASPFVAEDWELRVLVGNADAVFVQLVGERAAGQSHAAGGFGLCAASCT